MISDSILVRMAETKQHIMESTSRGKTKKNTNALSKSNATIHMELLNEIRQKLNITIRKIDKHHVTRNRCIKEEKYAEWKKTSQVTKISIRKQHRSAMHFKRKQYILF